MEMRGNWKTKKKGNERMRKQRRKAEQLENDTNKDKKKQEQGEKKCDNELCSGRCYVGTATTNGAVQHETEVCGLWQ
jgi:hypothetical protein